MPKLQVGDVNLNYDLHGKGEPLLMIMGLGASSAAWDPELVEDLARTFRVITFDNRGTGQSDKPDAPYSIEMFADDAAGLLKKLEVPRAHIFGVSMGGMIAQEFALRHPNQTATLTLGCTTAGGTHSVPPPPESLKILTAPREGVSPEEVIRRGWPLGYTAKYIAENRGKLETSIPRLLKHPT
ncbi:MAG TPA: alpha/beta hydrolase, partial [Sporolactobacillaceae bacterium]|nr:alpha/beta hydrolase [Sporolactobacillaceae bacterium]